MQKFLMVVVVICGFAGQAHAYFHASWHTRVMMDFGSFTMMAGPKNPVHCKYQTDATGTPDWNSGNCTATIQNATTSLARNGG